MSNVINLVPRAVFFLAGVAVGALTGGRREREGASASAVGELKESIGRLEIRIATQEISVKDRFQQVDERLDEQAAKLAEMPSTGQIIGAMEQILARSMASLDERMANQAHSIEVLRTTVSQTDTLLERVLESLDSLQTGDPNELVAETVLTGPRSNKD